MASAEETVNNQEGAADIDEDQIDDGVAIDHNEAVDDSALGSDWGSSTNSLSSSVLNYTYENGRRYHSFRAGNYFMPNDEQEQDSMDLWHHISTMILEGELFRAPIKDPRQILEIGTGTGIWAIDVADKYPLATVDATDLSPIQPTWVPPNLQFHVDDCESPWDFGVKFDFIHMRNLSGSIADWPKLLDQAYAALRPGGWIEVSNIEAWGQSYNNSLPKDSASTEWQENLRAAASTSGRELNVGPLLYQLITAAGFVNVQDDKQKVPFPWENPATQAVKS
jgi:SAM-dependent methyltransferase